MSCKNINKNIKDKTMLRIYRSNGGLGIKQSERANYKIFIFRNECVAQLVRAPDF